MCLEKENMESNIKIRLENILWNLSKTVNKFNPEMRISGYRVNSLYGFLEDLEFELAKLNKDKIGIQNYYDKNLKDKPVYEDWLFEDLKACNN